MKPDCKYFNNRATNPRSITGYFNHQNIICDNYSCPANGGKFLSAIMDNYIGFCSVNGKSKEIPKLSSLKK